MSFYLLICLFILYRSKNSHFATHFLMKLFAIYGLVLRNRHFTALSRLFDKLVISSFRANFFMLCYILLIHLIICPERLLQKSPLIYQDKKQPFRNPFFAKFTNYFFPFLDFFYESTIKPCFRKTHKINHFMLYFMYQHRVNLTRCDCWAYEFFQDFRK